MITFIVTLIIGIYISSRLAYDTISMFARPSFSDYVFGIVIFFFCLFIAVLSSNVIAALVGFMLSQEPKESERIELVSFNDTIGLSGNFFLGTGHIDNKLVYFAYAKHGEGYKAIKIEDAIIYEDTDKPYIQKYESEFIWKYAYLFGLPMKEFGTHIHIPKGSIKQNFNLDLQ